MIIKRESIQPIDDFCRFWINARVFVLIDHDDYDWLSKYRWRIVQSSHCFYVCRRYVQNGKTVTVKMHREIMHTPPGMECHHKNLNPLDNRKSNLENLTPADHHAVHGKT